LEDFIECKCELQLGLTFVSIRIAKIRKYIACAPKDAFGCAVTLSGHDVPRNLAPLTLTAMPRVYPRCGINSSSTYSSTHAILSTLVAPGVPNGTPAVTTTRWPGRANSSLWAMPQALPTISLKLEMSSVSTQCTPQPRASRRAVAICEVRHRIGTSGRWRATRSAVDPEVV